jgi:hypothetical protein
MLKLSYCLIFLVVISPCFVSGQGGVIDFNFGQNGVLQIDHALIDEVAEMDAHDDKLIIAGTMATFDSLLRQRSFIQRFDQDGDPDLSFGDSGLTTFNIPNHFNTSLIDFIHHDTSYFCLLKANPNYNLDTTITAVIRIKQNGELDSSFADSGFKLFSFNSHSTSPNKITLDEQNRILITGVRLDTSFGFHQEYPFLLRLNENLDFDSSFAGTGVVFWSPFTGISNSAMVHHGSNRHTDGATFYDIICLENRYILSGFLNGFETPRAASIAIDTAGVIDQSYGTGGLSDFNIYQGYSSIIMNSFWIDPYFYHTCVQSKPDGERDLLVIQASEDGQLLQHSLKDYDSYDNVLSESIYIHGSLLSIFLSRDMNNSTTGWQSDFKLLSAVNPSLQDTNILNGDHYLNAGFNNLETGGKEICSADDYVYTAAYADLNDTNNIRDIIVQRYSFNQADAMEEHQVQQIMAYPNPCSKQVSFTLNQTYESIEFYSITGQFIFGSNFQQSYDVSILKPGFYFAKLIQSNNQEFKICFIKE